MAVMPAAATTVEEESFRIELPEGFEKFTRQAQTVKSENGDIEQVTYISKDDEGDIVIVTYGQMPGVILDPEATMNSGRESLVKSLNATLAGQRKIEIDGKPGISFEYSAEKPRMIFARTDLVVAGPRLYQVIYLTQTVESLREDETEEIFTSFDLNDQVIELATAEVTRRAQAKASSNRQ
ncbi:MAG TPA: hypothetical protein VM557_03895 [Thermoanaerobaculia bacterium]|nr:hypothetical protein [Thermoanaerobaculia bacterium]